VAKIIGAASGDVPWHPHSGGMGTIGGGVDLVVDLADGHVDVGTTDMAIPGRGPDLTLRRTWDSTLAQAPALAQQGWVSSLAPSMSGILTGTVRYRDVGGAIWPFQYTGSLTATAPYTAYVTPPGQPWQLATSTAGYTLTDFLTSETWTFDGEGRLTADQDAYGNQNSLSYGAGSATSPSGESNSGGRSLAFGYTNGLLSEAQSPLWQSGGRGAAGSQHVTYGYNGSGQLTTRTLGAGAPDAVTTTFGYSGTQLISITTAANRTWALGYDPLGRVVAVTSPASGTLGQPGYTPSYTTQYSYGSGQTQVIAGAGTSAALTTTYTLDGQGELITVTDGLGHSTATTYDADHDVTSNTDANGNTTTDMYQYIGPSGYSGPIGISGTVGQLIKQDQPAIQPYSPLNATLVSPVITHTYDPTTHDLVATGLPEGGVTRYTYDGHHSVVAMAEQTTSNTCQAQCPTTWRGRINAYDQYGERVSSTDGRGVSVDASGNATLADPNGLYTSHTTYDPRGDLVAEGARPSPPRSTGTRRPLP